MRERAGLGPGRLVVRRPDQGWCGLGGWRLGGLLVVGDGDGDAECFDRPCRWVRIFLSRLMRRAHAEVRAEVAVAGLRVIEQMPDDDHDGAGGRGLGRSPCRGGGRCAGTVHPGRWRCGLRRWRPARRRPGVAVAFLRLALAVAGAGLGRRPAQPRARRPDAPGWGTRPCSGSISATITMQAYHTLDVLDLMVVRNPGLSYLGGTRLYILSSGPNQRTLDAITPYRGEARPA